jgi:putative phage-type endonuclease
MITTREIARFDQGSPEWLRAKLGVISASNISKVLAKKGSDTRNGYMMELVGQIATKEMDEFNGKALEWGKVNETAARAAYEFETGNSVTEVGFIYSENKRCGASPDGIIENLNKGLEIKNPFTARVHTDFLANDKIKPEYVLQCQFSMWVTGLEQWDFCSFHAKFKAPGTMLKIVTLERDPETMARFDDEVNGFIYEMDKVLAKLGLTFGEQWE